MVYRYVPVQPHWGSARLSLAGLLVTPLIRTINRLFRIRYLVFGNSVISMDALLGPDSRPHTRPLKAYISPIISTWDSFFRSTESRLLTRLVSLLWVTSLAVFVTYRYLKWPPLPYLWQAFYALHNQSISIHNHCRVDKVDALDHVVIYEGFGPSLFRP